MAIDPRMFMRQRQPVKPLTVPEGPDLSNLAIPFSETGAASPAPVGRGGMPNLGLSSAAGGTDTAALQNQKSNLAALLESQPELKDILGNNYLPQSEVGRLTDLQVARELEKASRLKDTLKERNSLAYQEGGFPAVVKQMHEMGLTDMAIDLEEKHEKLKSSITGNKRSLIDLDEKEFDVAMKKISAFGNAASVIESLPPEQRSGAYQQLKPEVEKYMKLKLPDQYNQLFSLMALTTVMDFKSQVDKNPYLMARLVPEGAKASNPDAEVPTARGGAVTTGPSAGFGSLPRHVTNMSSTESPNVLFGGQNLYNAQSLPGGGRTFNTNIYAPGGNEVYGSNFSAKQQMANQIGRQHDPVVQGGYQAQNQMQLLQQQGQSAQELAKIKGTFDLMQAGQSNQKEIFDQEAKLRGNYINESGEFQKINSAYGRIQGSAQNPSAAGDLALIFNYMKMLDPGSTVREGEFANAENSAGIPTRIRAQYNKLINGERLAPTQRQDFLNQAGAIYKQQESIYNQLRSQYEGISIRSGVNPQNVMPDYRVQSGQPSYSQEDLDFTAKKHGISVDEVKRRLGK